MKSDLKLYKNQWLAKPWSGEKPQSYYKYDEDFYPRTASQARFL